jgi:hypothetical protein
MGFAHPCGEALHGYFGPMIEPLHPARLLSCVPFNRFEAVPGLEVRRLRRSGDGSRRWSRVSRFVAPCGSDPIRWTG